MSKHTPGPWKFDGAEESHGSLEAESLVGADGDIVIRLEDDYPGYPECGEHLIMDIDSADARLIAAAPDLLEALKDAQATIDAMLAVIGDHCEPWPGDHQKDWHGFCESFDRIGEAIEKAEGKEGA